MAASEAAASTSQSGPDLDRLFREFLMPTIPSRMLAETIRASGDEKVRVRDLSSLLDANPAYVHFLMKLTFLANKVKDWKSEVPETIDHSKVITERILSLLGKDLIRNLTACAAISRHLGVNLPRSSKDTSLNLSPGDLIPAAVAAQEYCTDRKLMHADMAFNAGLHYDWLSAILAWVKASQDQKAAVKECFDEGFLIARIAYRMAQKMGKVRYDRFVFAGGLLVPAGKIVMSVLFPKELKENSWSQFLGDADKHPRGRPAFIECHETRRFPIGHLEISALLASFGQTLRPVERAICFADRPYYLDPIDPGLASLAGIWSVARTYAQAGSEKPDLLPHQQNFLRKVNLSPEILKAIASEVRAEKVG